MILWKHSAVNGNHTFSLHDCSATCMFVDQNNLYFQFRDGFWIATDTEYNPYEQTLCTEKSQVKICNYECSCVYVFEEIDYAGEYITQRVSFPLETFMNDINSGKWELEFLCEYHTYGGVLFECWIWSKDKPYHRECQLQIACDKIEYFWNDLDRSNLKSFPCTAPVMEKSKENKGR